MLDHLTHLRLDRKEVLNYLLVATKSIAFKRTIQQHCLIYLEPQLNLNIGDSRSINVLIDLLKVHVRDFIISELATAYMVSEFDLDIKDANAIVHNCSLKSTYYYDQMQMGVRKGLLPELMGISSMLKRNGQHDKPDGFFEKLMIQNSAITPKDAEVGAYTYDRLLKEWKGQMGEEAC